MKNQLLRFIIFVLSVVILQLLVNNYTSTKDELSEVKLKNEQFILKLDSLQDKLDSIQIQLNNRKKFIESKKALFKIPSKFIEEGHFDYLEEITKKYKVSFDLVLSQIKQESNFDQFAVSWVGAKGYLQMMDRTADETASKLKFSNFNVYDAKTNLEMGVYYLSKQLKRFDGNISLALAAYNAGPHRVKQYNGVPPYKETIKYVKNITQHYEKSQI